MEIWVIYSLELLQIMLLYAVFVDFFNSHVPMSIGHIPGSEIGGT